jgi:hypothetical protein
VETPSPSYRACSDGFSEETEAKKVTGSDRTLASGAPARPVSSGRSAHEGAERADASRGTPARPVHFCMATDAGTGRSASASGANDVSAWLGNELIERWGASDRTPPDASGLTLCSLESLCSTPDAMWSSIRCLAPARPVLL